MALPTNKEAYPNGRRRFEARKGRHTLVFWAGSMVEAYAKFEGHYSEPLRHLAWDWIIEEVDDRPAELVEFLSQAGRKGGQARASKSDNNPRLALAAPATIKEAA